MVGEHNLRKYEMSMWTLQDDFVAVLKPYKLDPRGHIQNPIMRLNVDGTEELSFSIPMYLYDEIEKKENPIWYDVTNNSVVTNMYKIKVIFNKEKRKEERKIFEFLITKITERHEVEEMYCDVECEGLAFHELGKTGYKISLSSDDFYADDLEWFENNGGSENQPIANLNYWAKKIFPDAPKMLGYKEIDESKVWKYEIRMDWSDYNENCDSDEVYEEPYATNWDDQGNIISDTFGEIKVKERLLDEEESNKYNLSQKIAEKFGVYCRYEYEHDDDFHICGRKAIFYNSFLVEDDFQDLTYKYNTSSISREMDGTDLVTQMYVRPVNNTAAESGWSTIMDAPPNLSKEDYLFNLDYLYNIGTIDEEQYKAISKHERDMRSINLQLIPDESQMAELEKILPDFEARLNVSKNAINLDQERITAADNLLNNLTNNTGILHITEANPKTAVLLEDKREEASTNSRYIKISEHGIISETVRIFRKINFGNVSTENTTSNEANDSWEGGRLEDELFTGHFELDEFGELVRISNLYKSNDNASSIVYLTYDYQPKLYYERVKATWMNRLSKDLIDADYYQRQLDAAQNKYNTVKHDYERLLKLKANNLLDFQLGMGAALREGYWQPDDYTDYGEKHIVTIGQFSHDDKIGGDVYSVDGQQLISSFWDDQLFEDELNVSYELGPEQNKKYYPCIKLDRDLITALSNKDIDKMCLLFYDYNYDNIDENNGTQIGDKYLRAFPLHSRMEISFVVDSYSKLTPVLMLTGIEDMTEAALYFMQKSAFLGVLNVTGSGDQLEITANHWIGHNNIHFINLTASLKSIIDEDTGATKTIPSVDITNPGTMVYPRIQIFSSMVKNSDDQFSLKYEGQILNNYTDYYISTKINPRYKYRWQLSKDNADYEEKPDESWEDEWVRESPLYKGHVIDVGRSNFYITIKPEVMIKLGNILGKVELLFTLSNADTSIYLDAIQVLKDSAYPRVSYSINVNSVNKTIIQDFYNYLNRIVHINDYELKFENVMGYISELTLHLDTPWEDEVEVKNYKTKFEDLFTTIVAQTEAMKKATYIDGIVSQAFSNDGTLTASTVKNSIMKVDLNYAFNSGKLTIDEKNGIWGVSDSGVVAFRGGGIFTATEKDSAGNWKWNTGIVPQGINADLISTGQLDTNLVRVYAGDQIRFQLNGDGLFAYKSFFEDFDVINKPDATNAQTIFQEKVNSATDDASLDAAQYVVMNSNGLFLHIENGAFVLNRDKSDYVEIGEDTIITKKTTRKYRNIYESNDAPSSANIGDLWHDTDASQDAYKEYTSSGWNSISQNIYEGEKNTPYDSIIETTYTTGTHNRVEISWDGLILRNLAGQEMLRADPDTGNLYVKGVIAADEFLVKGTRDDTISIPFEDYLGYSIDVKVERNLEKIQEQLKNNFDLAGEIIAAASNAVTNINDINVTNNKILQSFKEDVVAGLTPITTKGPYHHLRFKAGDVWEKTDLDGNKSNIDDNGNPKEINPYENSTVSAVYVATLSWSDVKYNVDTTDADKIANDKGWVKTHDYKYAAITGAALNVDAEAGTVNISGQNEVTIESGNVVNIGANGTVNITGNDSVNIGGTSINIASYQYTDDDNVLHKPLGGIHLVDSQYNSLNTGITSRVDLDANGIELASKNGIKIASGAGIDIKSGDANNISVVSIDKDRGVWIGSDKTISLFSGNTSSQGSNDDEGGIVNTGASVEISPSRIIFGLSNEKNGTAVEMTNENIILGATGIDKIKKDTTLQSTSGVIINNSFIRMATQYEDYVLDSNGRPTGDTLLKRNIISLDENGILLSSVSEVNNTTTIDGNSVKITKDSIDIYGNGTFSVNMNNFYVNPNATSNQVLFAVGGGANTLNETTYENMVENDHYGLKFIKGATTNADKLIIRGDIYANNGIFNGTVYATDGEFTGKITATSGFIGYGPHTIRTSGNNLSTKTVGWGIKSYHNSDTYYGSFIYSSSLESDGLPWSEGLKKPGIYLWSGFSGAEGGELVVKDSSGSVFFRVSSQYYNGIGDVHIGSDNDFISYNPNSGMIINTPISLSKEAIESIQSGVDTKIYSATDLSKLELYTPNNGTLGIVYKNNVNTSVTNYNTNLDFISDTLSVNDNDEREKATYFTLSRYWNIGSNPQRTSEDYYRVGYVDTASTNSAVILEIDTTKTTTTQMGFVGDVLTLNFSYKNSIGSNWNAFGGWIRQAPITIALIAEIGSNHDEELVKQGLPYSEVVAFTTWTPQDGNAKYQTTDQSERTASLKLSVTKKFDSNSKIYLIFYATNDYSLTYIKTTGAAITGGGTINASDHSYGLYVRSEGNWQPITSSSGNTIDTSYFLRATYNETNGEVALYNSKNVKYVFSNFNITSNTLGGNTTYTITAPSGGATYTAGTGISISNNVISVSENYLTSIPSAANNTIGGFKTGYPVNISLKYYPVQIVSDSSDANYGKAYVNIPWINTTYSAGNGITLNNTTFSINYDDNIFNISNNKLTMKSSYFSSQLNNYFSNTTVTGNPAYSEGPVSNGNIFPGIHTGRTSSSKYLICNVIIDWSKTDQQTMISLGTIGTSDHFPTNYISNAGTVYSINNIGVSEVTGTIRLSNTSGAIFLILATNNATSGTSEFAFIIGYN